MITRWNQLNRAHTVNRLGKSNTYVGDREPYTQLTPEHVAVHKTDKSGHITKQKQYTMSMSP